MSKQLVLRNPPDDIMEIIAEEIAEKTISVKARRTISMTESVYAILRKYKKQKDEQGKND